VYHWLHAHARFDINDYMLSRICWSIGHHIKRSVDTLIKANYTVCMLQVLASIQILLLMKPTVVHSVAVCQQVSYGLHDMLRTNAANIHDGQVNWLHILVRYLTKMKPTVVRSCSMGVCLIRWPGKLGIKIIYLKLSILRLGYTNTTL